MSQLLKNGQVFFTVQSNTQGKVEKFLGGGTQGEVYQVNLKDKILALKWYFPEWINQDDKQKSRLEEAIKLGIPTDRFLWPLEIVNIPDIPETYGYIMPLRESRFKGVVDMMKRQVEPSFHALATAGFELSNSYYQLHSKGLCYRDISFGNVFFDPDTGEVRICDNDNVDINGKPGMIGGTPDFMAPEIVIGKSHPSSFTDLYSLAVLLFYLFHVHHPLCGKKMLQIKCWDLAARRKIFGEEPVFIFDTDDTSNEALSKDIDETGECGDNALAFWQIYPKFFRDLFTKAFTQGLRDPENGRIAESIWRGEMIRLRDSIFYCSNCGSENFYDLDKLKSSSGDPGKCWSCESHLAIPPRIRFKKNIIMLNNNTKIFPHHVDDQKRYDFSNPIAEVIQHPTQPNVWGLKNLSDEKWVANVNNSIKEVEPGRSVTLALGTKVNFGKDEGEIRA
ncbi:MULTISPECIES: protein kinase domain-containing protein [Arthrospira]|jgi:serine/threonine protein kinase|uniref:Serine/threonine protein kinase n=1 Tax=Limnospira platensis NIES-46 TaxID=1236695 RepID=A0A5M3TDD4_LIMPL|nr:serine/threonine protein kinase [Arthrospira platensis]AMW31084.1 serine/threonine protein kinase [Arthrospira platensis YZ]KDR58589.1 serine/threonine protein kinase [Arthrospira platensis str. Paraca]MBD2671578.1 serine/threonine protein kinase [Arthrospira platensis FACHB-439]MBD2713125.1 serine/threonine protein kinase [Arthrospira platensis FACHB-835]MDF2208485.1 serine/threonine protein kinase [Arthrospira platensis NCB002]MDT9185150.1 serine/threonine protein kinase [Limnospira sp. 